MLGYFLHWQFVDSPKKLWKAIVKNLSRVFNYFSIGYLLKTLFAPWKRDISSIINPSLQDYFKIFVDNLIARIMGFLVRAITIIAGIIVFVVVFIVSIIIFIFWITLPLSIIFLIYKSITGF